jgi:CDP-diacylglycerol--serine O-phosphatidyltransferase
MKQLPNILTLANLFCGALAVVFVLQSPVFVSAYNGQEYLVTAPPPIYWGSVMIGLGAVFDFFDGLAARWLRVTSPLGRELDSLADVVTFGLAPGLILYQLLQNAYMRQPEAMEVSLVTIMPALLIPCFAAYRLARFNLDNTPRDHFLGMPTPAAGLFIASLPWLTSAGHGYWNPWLEKTGILYLLIAILCLLMVCRIPFFHFKMKNFALKANGIRYLLVLMVLISIPFFGWATVPLAFVWYIVLCVGKYWLFPKIN